MTATAGAVIRWAARYTWTVIRARSWDVLLLLIAIAVTYVLRGAARNQVLGSLRDALWFLVSLAIFFVVVFATKLQAEFRTLHSRWKGFVIGEPGRPSLHLEPEGNRFSIAAIRCVLDHESGARFTHEWQGFAATNHGLGPIAHFPATFIAADEGNGAAGEYSVRWSWKERESDHWIRAWSGSFTYDPDLYYAQSSART